MQACTYGLLGHLLQHSMALCGALLSQEGLLNLLLLGLGDKDPAVWTPWLWAMQPTSLVPWDLPWWPWYPVWLSYLEILRLISCNQCCISYGQLGAWRFRGGAVKCQVPPRFLEKACGDSQVNVKEATLPPSLPSRASDKSPASIRGWWHTALED